MNRSQLPMVLLLPTVLTVLVMAGGVQCNGELPSIDHVYQILKYSFIYDTLDIIDTQITCLAQGTKKDTYRELSMIVLVRNKIGWICQVQFEMDCSKINNKNIWTTRPNTLISSTNSCRISSRESVLGSNITIYTILEAPNNSTTQGLTITTTRYDCYHCMKTTIISLEHDHHCYACNSSCYTTGLRRCTGPTSSECCVAFNEEGTCINTISKNKAKQLNNNTSNDIHNTNSRATSDDLFTAIISTEVAILILLLVVLTLLVLFDKKVKLIRKKNCLKVKTSQHKFKANNNEINITSEQSGSPIEQTSIPDNTEHSLTNEDGDMTDTTGLSLAEEKSHTLQQQDNQPSHDNTQPFQGSHNYDYINITSAGDHTYMELRNPDKPTIYESIIKRERDSKNINDDEILMSEETYI